MIAAIMQPYFFPYIGYFQLMKAVDVFVLYDDAQYIKGGWINRNRICINKRASWLTMPVRRASLSLPINQRHYLLDQCLIKSVKRQLQVTYARANAYDEVSPVLTELFDSSDSNVASFNARALSTLAQQLGIECRFLKSSRINISAARGEAKVIDICHEVGATSYVNSIGGTTLYDAARFKQEGLRLSFLRTTSVPAQLSNGPTHLSIIDTLMHIGFAECAAKMSEFEIIEPDAAVSEA